MESQDSLRRKLESQAGVKKSKNPTKIRPYVEIGIGLSALALIFTGLLFTFLSMAFFAKSGLPDYALLIAGIVMAFGSMFGTLKFFYHLDTKQHEQTNYRHFHI